MTPGSKILSILTALSILTLISGCGNNTNNQKSTTENSSSTNNQKPTTNNSPPPKPIHFTDITKDTGIDITWTSGKTPSTQILEVKGGGIALIDFDNDNDLDVFVPNGATMEAPNAGPGCKLYENLGEMKFKDVTTEAGLTFRRWGVGVAVGDYNNDGNDDIYITCYGKNALLKNNGNKTFEEVTDQAGVGGSSWSAAAAFGDLDNDGDLDLYVANYLEFDINNPPPYSAFKGASVFKGPRGLPPQQDVLYENLGDGTFKDITKQAGCEKTKPAFGLGAVILDFNNDGLQDIYAGNDSTPNFLYINQGNLTFKDIGIQSGIAVNIDGSDQSTMGIAIGDVSGNGYPDVFTTNFSNDSNTLHINKSGKFFDDETRRYGVGMLSFSYVGWAAGFYDLDHDADEDLILFNGHVYPNASVRAMDSKYLEPPMLYERVSNSFTRITEDSAGSWLSDPHCDRGAAFGDLDNDGDIDAVIVELNGPVRVLRNDLISDTAEISGGGGWLIVELQPTSLGSKIELRAGDSNTQTRWPHSGGSFASASAQYAHFGLTKDTTQVDLTITWPGGDKQELKSVDINQHLVVDQQ